MWWLRRCAQGELCVLARSTTGRWWHGLSTKVPKQGLWVCKCLWVWIWVGVGLGWVGWSGVLTGCFRASCIRVVGCGRS